MLSTPSALLAFSAFLASSMATGKSTCPPKFTLAFTGTVDVATALRPITIPGGIRILEPLTGGSFSGPLLNATVTGGLAYPTILNNNTRQDPFIIIYGTTADNSSFLARISGVGLPDTQLARVEVELGGVGRGAANQFIVASVEPNEKGTLVAVRGYLVEQ
ncbi:hypothetical protein G7Y79_00021g050740 [Physcia stellaris]|nr:hypothetical protein G7Y79_00021g050740 [Physcia stellaris]